MPADRFVIAMKSVVCRTLHNRFDEFRLMSKGQRRPHDPLDIHGAR
jgi:hypothetical protein